jgi:hypothetical protein
MNVIYGFGTRSTATSDLLIRMRAQLDELQRQLTTGKKSETYGGLGPARGIDLDMRARLARIDAYQDTIFNVDLRVKVMNISLDRLRAIGRETRGSTVSSLSYELVSGGQTGAQQRAQDGFEEALSLLNGRAGDRYLFSGRATDRAATETSDHILNGNGAATGLKQVMSERLQADQGADGRGRLDAPVAALGVVTLAEDGVHPFGFKLAAATTDFAATVTGPAGAPPSLSIDLGGSNPPEGGKVHIQLNLPDGSSSSIDLVATNTVPPPANGFAIGATADISAQNLAAAIDAEIQLLTRTELAAASAMQASNDFFAIDADNPPQRVDGPPFDSATALRDATATDTVRWYTGDDATDNARSTAVARVDDGIAVAYGARANEEALRSVVQSNAAFAAMTFSPTDPDAQDRYFALAQRVGAALDAPPGVQKIEAIQIEIANASLVAGAAKQRLAEKQPILLGIIDDIENISPEEIGAKLLALNTRLQATLQLTALLSRLSLVNFI